MKTINSFRSKLLALTLALMASVSTFAYDFQDGYLFYNILADGTVAVTNERLGLPYNNLPASLMIPSEVTGNYGAKYQVSEIADYAFQGCDKLESLVIPNTVKKIGMYAFTGCSKLLNISFPESLEDVMAGALYECAWYDNQPDGLVYVGNLLYRYKGIAPTGVITINEGTKAVLGLAFSNQPNITSVILPESVTSVRRQAFGDCPNLESVTLPTWLSVIEDYTFQNCSKLQNINLPLGLDQIGKEAFAGCSSLTILDWPLQLKNIGARAFYNCNQLDGIENISPNIEKIGANAFCNTAWESKQPSGYLYIHNIFYAYTGEVTDSMHIEIKKGTTYISGGAVSRCVTKINEYSTKNVVSKITIPNSVTEIEDETFRYCRNLDTIICTSVKPPLISENTFNLTLQKNKHVLLVPTKALDIYSWMGLLPYEAAPYWNNFTNVKPITDPYVYDPMYFEKDSIQYHITNDTLAPYEVEVTHWYGLYQWEMEGHNYPELTTANIPATVTYKGTTYLVTRVGKMAFYHAPQLQHVTIGENVKIIDERAFAVCRNLSQVVIGENVDSILLNAFASGTSKIKVLDIPKNVKFIENQSLSAYSLEAINVHPDNANYTSVDGVLFNKQKNYLQEFPRSKATTYMIPDCVDTIGNLAFASNHNIISISFSPNSQLKHIEKEAFMGCVFMQRLDLPASLQSIEERAFNGCSLLEAITSLNPTPPVMSAWYSFNEQVFGSVSHDIPLFVPAESVELYDAAPQWDRFGTILPIGTITMNDFPTLAGLQRTSFNAYMGSSLFSAETNIRYIKNKAYLDFHGYFLREENNQVLIYSRRLGKDLILYDYSLEVGDTLTTLNFDYRCEDCPLTDLVVDYPIPDPYGSYDPIDTLIVTNILYVTLLDGKEYKQWTFNNGMQYVEGIGQFGQSIWAGDFFALIRKPNGFTWPDTRDYLVCASRNGQLLYQMDDTEMERLGAECLCEVETSYKSQWCNTWNVMWFDGMRFDETARTSKYRLGKDTVIGDYTYSKFISGTYVRFTDDRKVYVYHEYFDDHDPYSEDLPTGEYLAYDFSAQVGDTLEVFSGVGTYSTYPCVVDDVQIDSETNLRTMTLHKICRIEDDGFFEEYDDREMTWIEGVGSPEGFLISYRPCGWAGGGTYALLCAYQGDELKYTGSLYERFGCDYKAGVVSDDLFPTLSGLQRTICREYCEQADNKTRIEQFTNLTTRTETGGPYLYYSPFLLREKDNKILIYSRTLNKDLVLYDFNLQVGDSLPMLYIDTEAEDDWIADRDMDIWYVVDYHKDLEGNILPADTLIVTDVSMITLLDGKEYKKWTFNNGMEYVEGIGSFGNGQWSGDLFQLIANKGVPTCLLDEHLVCVSKNGQLLYQMDDAEMERLGAECLCEVEKKWSDTWCNQWNILSHGYQGQQDPLAAAHTSIFWLSNNTVNRDGHEYFPLMCSSSMPEVESTTLIGELRFTEDKQVYFNYDNTEYLLYDFDVQVGDTLDIFGGIELYSYSFVEQKTYPHVITKIDTLDDGRLQITSDAIVIFEDGEVGTFEEKQQQIWIEGLGSINGIVHTSINPGIGGNPAIVMLCAYRDDECVYKTDSNDPYWIDYTQLGCVYNEGDFIEGAFPILSGLQRTVYDEFCGEAEIGAVYTGKQTFDKIFFENDKPYILCNDYLLREEDNKILIYSQLLNKDLVLYDFTLEVGDSLPALYIDYHARNARNAMDWMPYNPDVVDYNIDFDGTIYPADTFVVTDISNVTLLDGKEYKKWTFDNGMEYVEGIGMYGGRRNGDFFGLIREVVVPCHIGTHLVCVSKNNKLLYQMDDAEMERLGAECLCEYNSGPKKDNAKNGKIGGRPTPTQWNMLEVETKEMDGTPTILRAETFSYTLENDSLVAKGKTYYQLARQSTKDTAITKSFVGALHFGEDEDNRVYFLRDGVEYVLYDFTAEPGDTIEIFAGINNYPQETTYTHVVIGKDTLENGACRMMLEVVFPEETASVENAQKVWLAGLGSIDGIVHNAALRATKARSSDTQTSIMLCAWRDDNCLYTTDHPDYDTYGCVYNQDPTAVEDVETLGTQYQKILRDGHLYILRDNRLYDVLGTPMN